MLLDPVTRALQLLNGVFVSEPADPVTGVLLGKRLAVYPDVVGADEVGHRLAISAVDGDVVVRHGSGSLTLDSRDGARAPRRAGAIKITAVAALPRYLLPRPILPRSNPRADHEESESIPTDSARETGG